MTTVRLRTLRVLTRSAAATRGQLVFGGARVPCAIGKGGVRAVKREGDGASPRGTWAVRRIFYRPDHGLRPRAGLPLTPLRPHDGWCDAPGDRNYNRLIRHPYPSSAERMWRPDHLYDIVVVLGHNDRPRRRGMGSAIFMHLARTDDRGTYQPTEGCIALSRRDLLHVLRIMTSKTRVLLG